MLELNKIYNMDCLEGMKLIDDKSVDLIITDPPFLNEGNHDLKFNRMSEMNKDDYVGWTEQWVLEFSRVLKPNGSIYIFCGREFYLVSSVLDKHFFFKNNISWIKPNRMVTTPQLRNWFPKTAQIVFFTVDEKDYTWNPIVKKYGIKNTSNYQIISNINSGMKEDVGHPSQKPVELVKKFIEASSNSGDLVLDSFIGSGTTAVVCKKMNRRFIGFEIDKHYFDIANKRLDETYAQTEMFK